MEDDHDELLQCTDDESLSENEEHCLPVESADRGNYRNTFVYCKHSKFEFITTKIALIISASFMLILLPPYMESINVKSDVYSLILVNISLAVMFFTLFIICVRSFSKTYKNLRIFSLPIKFPKLLLLTILYIFSGFMIVYALDRKRVLCHLQDPIKGLTLVFSLLYYFIFCKKFMGLQRIFSATTIIVGLFIGVDYGLCDEFKCRGFDRKYLSDDTGNWDWKTHSIWTAVYICGLAVFSAYFTLLDRYLLLTDEPMTMSLNVGTSFLSTVSSSVSYPTVNTLYGNNLHTSVAMDNVNFRRKHSSLHIAMWIHIIGWILVVLLFWTDIIPFIGKGSNGQEFLNYTKNGIMCHFKPVIFDTKEIATCGNVAAYSWLFLFSYMFFFITSVKFLILSQSAVYTVASITASLPIVGIWWSLFHMVPPQNSVGTLILWSPSVTGELICSLLGLPIVCIGLCLFCKSHFMEYQWPRLETSHITYVGHFG